jgi:predicted nucleotidyltransferase
MEYTKNKLPEKVQKFFNKMSKYINSKIYFYGSIQRNDYLINNSDIDICVFTDNTQTMIHKIQHFLHLKKEKFKKIMWTAHPSNTIVYGYKTKYTSKDPFMKLEITIYTENYKKNILEQHNIKSNLPFYAIVCLIILKFMYYTLCVISKKNFSYYKNKLTNISVGHDDNHLFIISSPNIYY